MTPIDRIEAHQPVVPYATGQRRSGVPRLRAWGRVIGPAQGLFGAALLWLAFTFTRNLTHDLWPPQSLFDAILVAFLAVAVFAGVCHLAAAARLVVGQSLSPQPQRFAILSLAPLSVVGALITTEAALSGDMFAGPAIAFGVVLVVFSAGFAAIEVFAIRLLRAAAG